MSSWRHEYDLSDAHRGPLIGVMCQSAVLSSPVGRRGHAVDAGRFGVVLDPLERNSLERLQEALSSGGVHELRSELDAQLDSGFVLPAFVLMCTRPDVFNLTMLRRLAKRMRSLGHLEPARIVLEDIVRVSGSSRDVEAVERLRQDLDALRPHTDAHGPRGEGPEGQSSGAPSAHEDSTQRRNAVALVVSSAAAGLDLESTPISAPTMTALLDSGAQVHVLWLGQVPSDECFRRAASVKYLSTLHTSRGSLAWQLKTISHTVDATIRSLRPALVHVTAALFEAREVLRRAHARGVRTIWEPITDEGAHWRARHETPTEAERATYSLLLEQAHAEAMHLADEVVLRSEAQVQRVMAEEHQGVRRHPVLQHSARRALSDDAPPRIFLDAQEISSEELTDWAQLVGEALEAEATGDGTSHHDIELVIVGVPMGKREQLQGSMPDGVALVSATTWGRGLSRSAGTRLVIVPRFPGLVRWRAWEDAILHLRHSGASLLLPRASTTLVPGPVEGSVRMMDSMSSEAIRPVLQDVLRQFLEADPGARKDGEGQPSSLRSELAEFYRDAVPRPPRPERRQRRIRDPQAWEDAARDIVGELVQSLPEHSPVDSARHFNKKNRNSARGLKNEGWRFAEFPPIRLSGDVPWLEAASEHRTWGYRFHTWEFLDALVQDYRSSANRESLSWALDLALSWTTAVMHAERTAVEDPHEDPLLGTMVWYDMALAMRSPRLAALIHLAISENEPLERLRPLVQLAFAHRDAHWADEAFTPNNNHGFYAAYGQLILARWLAPLPGMAELQELGEERMGAVARQQFLADGGHAEHSPDYHRMLLDSFREAQREDLISDPDTIERMRKASWVLGWYVQPDSTMLQLGDSPARQMRVKHSSGHHPTTQFLLTGGAKGEPDTEELLALEDTGVGIVRSPQPRSSQEISKSSYLAFAAGFHSRAHKHCDDLSLVWFHRGHQILIDAGRHSYGQQLPKDSPLRDAGFFYASQERRYVESALAHNVVTVDGRDHDRRRQPYGSGLIEAERVEPGRFRLVGEVPHTGWRHRRTVLLDVERGLEVTDEITADDDDVHTYAVHFALEGDLAVTPRQGAGAGYVISSDDLALLMRWDDEAAVGDAVQGQEDPLRGWRSRVDRTLEPAWSVRRTGVFRGSIRLRTFISVVTADVARAEDQSGTSVGEQEPSGRQLELVPGHAVRVAEFQRWWESLEPGEDVSLSSQEGCRVLFRRGGGSDGPLVISFHSTAGLQKAAVDEVAWPDHQEFDQVSVVLDSGDASRHIAWEQFRQIMEPLVAAYLHVYAIATEPYTRSALYYGGSIDARIVIVEPGRSDNGRVSSETRPQERPQCGLNRATPRSMYPPLILSGASSEVSDGGVRGDVARLYADYAHVEFSPEEDSSTVPLPDGVWRFIVREAFGFRADRPQQT